MSPSNVTCIPSTLVFLSQLADKHSLPPIITFDQSLFWNASDILQSSNESSSRRNIVLMLDRFHTFMNILGAIETLMEGSGLREILQEVYGENAVYHMTTGKSTSTALRGHLLVDRWLISQVLSHVFPSEHDQQKQNLLCEASTLYDSVLSRNATAYEATSSPIFLKLNNLILAKKRDLCDAFKTSRIWL